MAKWRRVMEERSNGGMIRIGVVWAGNPKHRNDRNRSVPFALFKQLLAISHVCWISLQEGERAEDLKETVCPVIDISQELVDFSETAGLIANIDLVITIDSAVAHLAGAMGRKTWLLLPFAPDWRWQLQGDATPWYPSMQLYRQRQPGDWQEVSWEGLAPV